MPAAQIQTEADAVREILDWSKDRPAWQRDALRRLVTSGELSAQDIDELTKLCKNPSSPGDPLADAHVRGQRTGAPTVSLKNLRGVQNVNALVEGQTVNFISTGVTIVYGDNGAGKSGYVRILKRACRARTARGREEPILTNIYEQPKGPQRAELEYVAGAQTQRAEWKEGQSTDVLLSEISVFDSRTANVHVEETNDLAYTPYPMKLLERLVNACKAVKEKIDTEITAIRNQTPQSISNPTCTPTSAVGRMIASLGKDTEPKAVKALASLTETEILRLAELTADFSQDKVAAARRLRAQKARLQTISDSLRQLDTAIAPESAQGLQDLAKSLQNKQEAAKLASEKLFQSEPLKGVGSETWQALWEAARDYSTAEAYPEQSFPVTDDASHCVLCQQGLSAEAAARLQRFEAFVKDRTQQEEASARQALAETIAGLRGKMGRRADLIANDLFLRDELGNDVLATAIRQYTVRANWRLRDILRRQGNSALGLPELSAIGHDAVISGLETRAATILADDSSRERKALRDELTELQDRQWLNGIEADVLAEIKRRKNINKLELALRDTRPNTITAKNTSLSEALITDRLRARFAQEINYLELAGLAIELSQAGSQHGISRFKVNLIQSKSRNAGDILSEGEYRCVALAGFLAELATNDSNSGIIFDDPVSSLDHMHREAIAKRLAAEGRKRQVIVFTHDLAFLFLLRNACTQVEDPSLKTEIALRHIQKRANEPGYSRNEPPDKAQDANARLAAMRKHLSNTRVRYDQDPDGPDWLTTARGIIVNLRETWEAAVEDAISPVLRTFSSKVNTKGFAKLSAITEQDAVTMRHHYGQCSVLLHKASDALNPTAPKPETIEQELDALETWLQAIAERQNKISIS